MEIGTYFKERGFEDAASAEALINDAPRHVLLQLAADCHELIRAIHPTPNQSSLFNFSASKGLSGAGMNCTGLSCRIREASLLSQFASLYGECITIPDFLDAHRAAFARMSEQKDLNLVRCILLGDIRVLMIYAPLIAEGLISFNKSQIAHCIRCAASHTSSGSEKLVVKQSRDLLRLAEEKLIENLSFQIDGDRIRYIDPENYTDLGEHFIRLKDISSFKDTRSRILSPTEVKEAEVAQYAASEIVDDILQQYLGHKKNRTTFLTARRIDALLLDRLNRPDNLRVNEPPVLSTNMVHTLPIVSNGDFSALIHVRKGEEAAFSRYKNALQTVLRQLGSNPTPQMVQQALDEEVRPHLLTIDQVLQANKRRLSRRAKQEAMITGAVITVGAIVNSQAHLDAGALAGLSAIAAIPGIDGVRSFINVREEPASVQEDQYYFLWKTRRGDF